MVAIHKMNGAINLSNNGIKLHFQNHRKYFLNVYLSKAYMNFVHILSKLILFSC